MYKLGKKHRSPLRFWLLIALAATILTVGTVGVLRSWYQYNLRPISSSPQIKYFSIAPGSNVLQIAKKLEREGLIRSSRAFETYVRSNELHNKLKAGTYALNTSMSVEKIVNIVVEGDVAKNLLTILPAKRIDEVKQAFAKESYSLSDIETAFKPSTHRGHPALESLPAGASLEGYLYPDSFQKEDQTPAELIVKNSLDEMNKHLTSRLKAEFPKHNLSTFQAITLASIVLQETDDPAIQPIVAQVFLTRLKMGMLLQTDPTVDYASALAGVKKDLSIDSPYNTYKYKGLPPGPIGNVTVDALKSVAYPEKTDYLFFFTGDDGKFRFNRTQKDHEDGVREYCKRNCG
ncbi:endolytic transglycosylase MltG [Candidatus Saccharibacteria bacterium]|nr:endolytic transglycosylase MltG [Candidatus Saccharibacteria bacterium]